MTNQFDNVIEFAAAKAHRQMAEGDSYTDMLEDIRSAMFDAGEEALIEGESA